MIKGIDQKTWYIHKRTGQKRGTISMFNLKKAKSKNVAPFEKALETNRTGLQNTADENPSIHEDMLKQDRKDEFETITESQLDEKQICKGDFQIAEKAMKREKLGELYVPAINAFVEKIVQDRRKEFTSATKKESNWTTEKPTQNGDLPAWPKNAPQHDKKVIPNDVDRKQNQEALIGGNIVKASVNKAAYAIKTGSTIGYDRQIVEILKKANNESRELTNKERDRIVELKKTRTQNYIRKV